jgi:ribosomal-protein-alanine N-acetyltransferase
MSSLVLLSTYIQTARLILEPINREYAEDIFRFFTPEITQYMMPAPPECIDDTHAFIDMSIVQMQQGNALQLQILEKDTREFIGCCGIHDIHLPHPALGICIKKPAHGNGYGKEAVQGMIEWAKASIDYEYLRYPVDKRNIPSKRIPEQLGGIIGRELKKINQAGNELDEIEYWIYP